MTFFKIREIKMTVVEIIISANSMGGADILCQEIIDTQYKGQKCDFEHTATVETRHYYKINITESITEINDYYKL